MPGPLNEFTASGGTQMNALLKGAVDFLAGPQKITFTKYTKIIIPVDGFVFWVQSRLLDPATSKPTLIVEASLHTHTERLQAESELYSRNQLIMTSKTDAQQAFNDLGPDQIYIGTVGSLRLAFSRLSIYPTAGIFHYAGYAVYPHMLSQIIDDLTQFDQTELVVSNSLPLWLKLNNYQDFYGFGNDIPLYPSMLITPNHVPPFGAIHVVPGSTTAQQGTPLLGSKSEHSQYVSEKVRVTFYGVRHAKIMNFIDCVNQYSRDYNMIGLMNCPVVQDDKLGQSELSMLAMRKTVEYEVSYNQKVVRDIARQLITSASCKTTIVWPTHWFEH